MGESGQNENLILIEDENETNRNENEHWRICEKRKMCKCANL
jgi:hypothetical protein